MRIWYMRGRLGEKPGSDRQQYQWRAVRDAFPGWEFELLYLDDLPTLAHGWSCCDVVFVSGSKPVGAARDAGLDLKSRTQLRIYIADWQRNRQHLGREARALTVLGSHGVILGQTMHIAHYRKHSDHVHFVDRGFDPAVFYPGPVNDKVHGIVFCGNWQAFGRLRRLKMMSLKFPGQVDWRKHPRHVSMSAYLRSGRIGWNQIQKIPNAKGINYRVWETLGSGIMLLTNETSDVANVLVDGQHVVFWHDDKDLIKKAAFYLGHPVETSEIARNGHMLALQGHTWAHRGRQIRSIVEGLDKTLGLGLFEH